MSVINTIWNSILGIVFPMRCVSCGEKGTYFCTLCLADTPMALRESESWIFPVFDYRHPPIKKALWLLKYNNKKVLAEAFGEVLYAKILEELADLSTLQNFREAILVPIPLSRQRRRERGYNQAELIAKNLVKLDGNKNFKLETGVLQKSKDTEHQARIRNRNERLKNVIGSFALAPGAAEKIKNKNIILIDDILTTGATLSEAKKILRQGGARKIIAFTIAH